ncbi:phosphate ABC transporter permease subunit PstC [Catenulispora sp. NF23]|uniref:Phosphate transport system permease protein n=1 Tax=Catenulispora pinistramenti TaxID=2705254 RepID=A0ABS5KLC7_9ACTN|nr:phosphate ABC transporter permease subunit PstC [Catenulispora pinistramenti]MBS2532066.1 phosphate ABC transporter permease subunit PstC [Catenulispora pinistramenti]MBS2546839.1 phosphate ABC transporter permease subunit PstC [Catenulispora pinistramenti]
MTTADAGTELADDLFGSPPQGSGPGAAPAPADDTPMKIIPGVSRGDRVFRIAFRGAGLSVFAIMGLIALFLITRGAQALHATGWSFLTEQRWQTATHRFGVGAVLPDGIIIAVIALVIAVPVALSAALWISEYAPSGLRRTLISLIDLMAAVPSIVYGLWGLIFLTPRIIGFERWAATHLGGVLPFLKVRNGEVSASYSQSGFIAGVVVALMIIPIVCSLSREVFSQAPTGEREGAYALGATRWGMVRTVVLPFGKGGMIGAVMLGFGRAMGETIAVALIISPVFAITWHPLQADSNSISSLIALRYGESDKLSLSALMAAGLVLFTITLLVNMVASAIIARSRSGAATNE